MTEEGALIAGRYRLVARVGSGAMGVVWRGYDERLHRVVAVKKLIVPPGSSEVSAQEAHLRVMREGRIAARLHHAHAIDIYDVAEHEGQPCLIMEYLRADSLSTVLATRATLPPDEVTQIGSQIAAALTAAHQAGIVHRDIKPGNVLLADDGTAKITDFGISRAVGDSTLTATGIMAGTPAYLAPEVAKGQDAGFPSDVFSLGSTLYAAVEGQPPFGTESNTLALLYRIATDPVTPPTQAGPLGPVLMRLLHRDLSRRPTMREAHGELCAVAAELEQTPTREITAVATPAPEVRKDDGERRPRTLAAIVPRFVTALPAAVPAAAVSLLAVAAVLVGIASTGGQTTAEQAPNPPGATQHADARAPATTDDAVPQPAPAAPTTPDEGDPGTPTDSGAVTAPDAEPVQDAPARNEGPAPGTTEQLGSAVADYYGLMPDNLDAGWARLTGDYQSNHAGGFGAYQAFWDPVQNVSIAEVTATPPGTVSATVTYVFQDGRVVVERTTFGLVSEGGLWKIASSTVNSSRTTSS